MLKEIENTAEYIIIESDNCKSQYKSAAHFASIQSMADFCDKKVLQLFGMAEYGKGEVEHVGGISKTTIRCEIANGGFFSVAEEMVDFHQQKFGDHENPSYFVELIDGKYVNQVRDNAKLKVFHTIEGSSTFQVILFEPHSNILKAAKKLCICSQ